MMKTTITEGQYLSAVSLLHRRRIARRFDTGAPEEPNGPDLSPEDQRASERMSGFGGFLVGAVVGYMAFGVIHGKRLRFDE